MNQNEPAPLASHRILRKFSYLLSAYWVREVLQFLFFAYLARKSATIRGQFDIAITMGQIILFISEFGLNQHLATILSKNKDDPSHTESILAQVTLVKSGLLLTGFLIMMGMAFWQGYSTTLILLALAMGAGFGMEALATSFFVACQIQGRQKEEGVLRSVTSLGAFGYAFSTLALGLSPVFVALFKLVETFSNFLGAAAITVRRLRFRLRKEELNAIWATWRGGIVYTLIGASAILYNKINIFFLKNAAGVEVVPQYSVALQVVDGFSILVSGLLLKNVMFPLFLTLWNTKREEFIRLARTSTRWLFIVALPLIFILYMESDRIILIFGDKYPDAVWVQKYLSFSILIAFLHNLAAFLMISMQRQRILLVFYLSGLAFNLVFCTLAIPRYPLLGSSLAFVLTKAFVAVMTVGYCQIRIGLIPLRSLLTLLAMVLLGAALYIPASLWLFREAAELLALVPMAGLALYWSRIYLLKKGEPS